MIPIKGSSGVPLAVTNNIANFLPFLFLENNGIKSSTFSHLLTNSKYCVKCAFNFTYS